jgi:hypothetical protein
MNGAEFACPGGRQGERVSGVTLFPAIRLANVETFIGRKL